MGAAAWIFHSGQEVWYLRKPRERQRCVWGQAGVAQEMVGRAHGPALWAQGFGAAGQRAAPLTPSSARPHFLVKVSSPLPLQARI